jgi:Uma2 family endonuclease
MVDATASPLPVLANVDDFLRWVEAQPERYEFVHGRLVLMAGGSERHNDIQVNLLAALRNRLRGSPCKPNGSDLLIRIDDRTGRFPDASVSCGREGGHALSAPVVVFEVLSPTTELLDRTDKRRDYQGLPSLRHYVLIAQDVVRVEIYTRSEIGWRFQEFGEIESALKLDALDIDLPLAEIYEGLPMPPADAASAISSTEPG